MTAEKYSAEGAFKLAEIMSVKAEQKAQHLRKVLEWHEQYAPNVEVVALSNSVEKAENAAFAAETIADNLYKAWARMQ
jgi:hypothetical protein